MTQQPNTRYELSEEMNMKIHDMVLYWGLPSPSLILLYLLKAKPKVKIIDKNVNKSTGVVNTDVVHCIHFAASCIDSDE